MKRLLILAAILFAMLTATASCQTFDLNEKMLDAAFALDEQQALIPDASEQRVLLTLTVKGINKEDYKVDYTIDGKPGSGSNSLTIYDTAISETGLYSFGELHLDKRMYTDDYDGNFPSGSSTKLLYLNDGKYTHLSLGTAKFLSPKLRPGTHTIEYTVTNSYGQTVEKTTTFTLPTVGGGQNLPGI